MVANSGRRMLEARKEIEVLFGNCSPHGKVVRLQREQRVAIATTCELTNATSGADSLLSGTARTLLCHLQIYAPANK